MLAVVINEIHVDPDVSTEQVEFIELYNDSNVAVDVSGWVIDDAVDYTFPASTSIDAFDYYVVTQDATEFQTKFGIAPDAAWQVGDQSFRSTLGDAPTAGQEALLAELSVN